MALNLVVTGNTILSADINQLVNVLQRSAGQTEVGKYYLAGWGNAANDKMVCYIPSLSRGTATVSVSIDTADLSPTNVNAPITSHLTANGFAVEATTTGATTNGGCGGNYTIQYALFLTVTSLVTLATVLGHLPRLL
jgi:hypothetical protein